MVTGSFLKGIIMIFLDPRSDIAFKKLFGDTNHKNVLLNFVNTVLDRKKGELIVDVVFNDPYNARETDKSKLSIVDVRCTDETGKNYILEMQRREEKEYAIRAQYYTAKGLTRQILDGGRFKTLTPVIFIAILDFDLFEHAEYISHHKIINTQTYENQLKHMEFHFIELTKFNKNIDEVQTILEKWMYFFKHAAELQNVPQNFKEPEIQEAFDIVERATWSTLELDIYDSYMIAIWAYNGQMDAAEERGVERGIQKGIEKGIEKGELKKALEVAYRLLDTHDIKTIAEITGLSKNQIEELKNS